MKKIRTSIDKMMSRKSKDNRSKSPKAKADTNYQQAKSKENSKNIQRRKSRDQFKSRQPGEGGGWSYEGGAKTGNSPSGSDREGGAGRFGGGGAVSPSPESSFPEQSPKTKKSAIVGGRFGGGGAVSPSPESSFPEQPPKTKKSATGGGQKSRSNQRLSKNLRSQSPAAGKAGWDAFPPAAAGISTFNPSDRQYQRQLQQRVPSQQRFKINLAEIRRPVSREDFRQPKIKFPSDLTPDERDIVKENARIWVSALYGGGSVKIRHEWMLLEKDFENLKFEGDYSVVNFIEADRSKKRYRSVVCWDRTRVVLASLTQENSKDEMGQEGDEMSAFNESDFIHASHLIPRKDGRVGPHMPFIMTQAPMTSTLTDFWRMVWQEDVGVIVMLCACIEENKEKCAQYWPATMSSTMKIPQENPIFLVQTKRTELIENGAIQVCKMHLFFGSEARTVYHFQILIWPDKGTPVTLDPVLQLNKLAIDKQLKMVAAGALPVTSPILVHCSAGIGRTGTFVAISLYTTYLTNPVKQDSILNLYELVKYIRSQRAQSIQTVEQYFFCYESVLHFLTREELAVRPENANQMQKLPNDAKPEAAEIDANMDDIVTEKLTSVYQDIIEKTGDPNDTNTNTNTVGTTTGTTTTAGVSGLSTGGVEKVLKRKVKPHQPKNSPRSPMPSTPDNLKNDDQDPQPGPSPRRIPPPQ